MKTRLSLLAMLAAFVFAPSAHAAQLYFTPTSGQFQPGATVTLNLRLDNQDQCVNAAEVNIAYPRDLMEAIDVSRGNSIFTIWVTPPTVRQDYGLITMIGGIPNGYCGRTPGDPAVTNTIAELVFRFTDKVSAKVPVQVPITILPSSKVVLNNGLGTEAKLTLRPAQLVMSNASTPQPNEWTAALAADKTLPEPFSVDVYRDHNIFDNSYFAVFSTVDKQTGLDHYEVAEVGNGKSPSDQGISWKRTESPYILADQSLKSVVIVKAFDKAGNVRVAEYVPKATPPSKVNMVLFWALASLGVIFLAIMKFAQYIPW